MKRNIISLLHIIGFHVIFKDLSGLKLDVLDSRSIDNKYVHAVVAKFSYHQRLIHRQHGELSHPRDKNNDFIIMNKSMYTVYSRQSMAVELSITGFAMHIYKIPFMDKVTLTAKNQ